MSARLSGLAVAEVTAGLLLALSGVKNQTLQVTLKSVLSGKVPAAIAEPAPTIGVAGSASSGSTAAGGAAGPPGSTNSAIANDALQYAGHAYRYGGAPGPAGQNPWDCSSFCNWVLGHDQRLAIPGGSWASVTGNGSSHGPTTLSYLAWTGAATVSGGVSAAQPGDLCVWQTHMGICTGPSTMISALNESLGTKVTPISGVAPAGEVLVVRRVKA